MSKGDYLFYVFLVLVLFGIFRAIFELFTKSQSNDTAEEIN
ncbi:hypothetical protein ASZ90_004287 [hydrocarbon metagenome]|uniref:Uncharacterized protein n=1 Tax=hydrocarbon metagenome TaxID=938273 RepID=A0A0W8FYE7_9ZZZZ